MSSCRKTEIQNDFPKITKILSMSSANYVYISLRDFDLIKTFNVFVTWRFA